MHLQSSRSMAARPDRNPLSDMSTMQCVHAAILSEGPFMYSQNVGCVQKILRHLSPCILASGCAGNLSSASPDVVRLALVQRLHEALQLLPETSSHAVELVGALADPPRPRRGRRLCRLCVLKDDPAHRVTGSADSAVHP